MKKIIITLILSIIFHNICSSQTWQELSVKCIELTKAGKYEDALLTAKNSLTQAEKDFGKNTNYFAISLTNIAIICQKDGKYDSAEIFFKDAISLRKEILGTKNTDYTISLSNLFSLYRQIAEFYKAEPIILEYMEIVKEIKGEKTKEYTDGLDALAHCYSKKGNFSKSEELLLNSKKIKKEILGDNDPAYAITLNDLSVLYGTTGRFEESEKYIYEAIKIDRKIYGEKSPDYATDINNLALLYCETGKYDKGELLLKEALKIRKETLGKKNPSYVSTISDLAVLYDDMGRNEESEKFSLEALNITKSVLGTKNEYYAQYLNNLAGLYNKTGKNSEAENLYKESLSISKEINGEQSPYYAVTLNNIAWFYKSTGNFKNAEEYYISANKIIKNTLGDKHPFYAKNLGNLGLLYIKLGKYDKAEKLFLETLKIRKNLLGEKHPGYVLSLNNLADLYTAENRLDEAEIFFKKSNENLLNQIYSYYPYMSEKEKTQFLKTVDNRFEQFNSFALKRYKQNPAIAKDVLELSLATKGLILNSVTGVKNNILNSGDSALINEYKNYIALKENLNKVIMMTTAERQNKMISLKELESKTNEIEKNLSFHSNIFSSDLEKRNISNSDLQKTINDDEAFIDFLNFRNIDSDGIIISIYCATILRKDFRSPKLIKICDEKDLEKILSVSSENQNSYIKNTDKSFELYKTIWKPLESVIGNSKTVYISCSGLLNKISFASLNYGGVEILFDKYNINYCGNFKDIIRKEKEETLKKENFSIAVFGSAKYDLDSASSVIIAEKYSRGNDEEWSPPKDSYIIENYKSSANKWSFLQGTYTEASLIDSLFKAGNCKSDLYLNENASKEAIKKLNYTNSPSILHIATHGYFFNEPANDYSEKRKLNKFQSSSNPLIRSGLILSGANRVWMGGEEIEGIENGVLTALDISNLDLINTKLVVLSACETGLGDIKGGEGVYGLQRAFKIAGAKSIIMSLWKVPDKETAELMKLFYSNLLSGMTKHEAFNNAQKEMGKKYSPYYWSAFVMVE